MKSKSEDNHNDVTKLRLLGFNNKVENTFTVKRSNNSDTIIDNEINDDIKASNEFETKKKETRKLQRTRRITDDFITYDIKSSTEHNEEVHESIPLVNKNIVVKTNTQYVDATSVDNIPNSPISVFVETTRKVFTPFVSDTIIINNVPENTKASCDDEKVISECKYKN